MLKKCDLSALTFLLVSFPDWKPTAVLSVIYYFRFFFILTLFQEHLSVSPCESAEMMWPWFHWMIVCFIFIFKWKCSRKSQSVLFVSQRGSAAFWTGAISFSNQIMSKTDFLPTSNHQEVIWLIIIKLADKKLWLLHPCPRARGSLMYSIHYGWSGRLNTELSIEWSMILLNDPSLYKQ